MASPSTDGIQIFKLGLRSSDGFQPLDRLPNATIGRFPVNFGEGSVFPYPTISTLDPVTIAELNRAEQALNEQVSTQISRTNPHAPNSRCHTVFTSTLFDPNSEGDLLDRMAILDYHLPFRCFNPQGCCQAFCPVFLQYKLSGTHGTAINAKPNTVLGHFRCQNQPEGDTVVLSQTRWVTEQLTCQRALTADQVSSSLGQSFAEDTNLPSPAKGEPQVKLCKFHHELLMKRGSMLFWVRTVNCTGIISAISRYQRDLLRTIISGGTGYVLTKIGNVINQTLLATRLHGDTIYLNPVPAWEWMPYAMMAVGMIGVNTPRILRTVARELSIQRTPQLGGPGPFRSDYRGISGFENGKSPSLVKCDGSESRPVMLPKSGTAFANYRQWLDDCLNQKKGNVLSRLTAAVGHTTGIKRSRNVSNTILANVGQPSVKVARGNAKTLMDRKNKLIAELERLNIVIAETKDVTAQLPLLAAVKRADTELKNVTEQLAHLPVNVDQLPEEVLPTTVGNDLASAFD